MAHRRRPEPGLDETMSDEALDEFIWGPVPQLEEPPTRRWPLALSVGSSCLTLGLTIGLLIAPYVALLVVLPLIVVLFVTLTLSVVAIERSDRVTSS